MSKRSKKKKSKEINKVTAEKIPEPRSQDSSRILPKDSSSSERHAFGRIWFFRSSLLLLLFLGSFLLFKNLDNHYLWQDEAETALLAKTVLAYGMPSGYDGKNFFSQELGADYGKNYVWKLHPWFPFYLLAGFFGIFGVSTFVARLPFALFGLMTIVLLYFFSQSLWMSRRAGLIAALILALSVPFLLLARQCRYYSLAAFFALLGLYGYLLLTENKKFGRITFVIACILLFHIHYIYYVILLLTFFFHAFLFHRDKFKQIFTLSLLTVLINLPWMIWMSGLLSGKAHAEKIHNVDQALRFGFNYLSQMMQYIFPILILACSVLGFFFYKRRYRKGENRIITKNLILLLLFIFFSILILSFFSSAPFFRYLTPLIPVCCLLIALAVESYMRFHVIAGVAVIFLFIFFQPISNYLYEITHDYDGPIKGIVKYLNQHGKKDDIVAITYGDLSLKFYTDMRVVGGLTGEDLSPAKNADWVIIRKHVICEKDWKVRQYLIQNVPWHQYERITINYPDIAFENRESPGEHRYRTVTNEDRVVIYRRMK